MIFPKFQTCHSFWNSGSVRGTLSSSLHGISLEPSLERGGGIYLSFHSIDVPKAFVPPGVLPCWTFSWTLLAIPAGLSLMSPSYIGGSPAAAPVTPSSFACISSLPIFFCLLVTVHPLASPLVCKLQEEVPYLLLYSQRMWQHLVRMWWWLSTFLRSKGGNIGCTLSRMQSLSHLRDLAPLFSLPGGPLFSSPLGKCCSRF